MLDLLLAAESTALPDPNTVVTAAATVVASAFAVIGIWIGARARRNPKDDQAEPVVAPSPLSQFSGTQDQFMAMVIRDSEQVRGEIAGLKSELSNVKQQLADRDASYGKFERAVRRYLELLSRHWPGPAGMPWPDPDDAPLLEHALPRQRGRAT